MTREETMERIKLMQAYVDGKTIECLDKFNDKWEQTPYPAWDPHKDYRIKPEITYRPFESVQEYLEEAKKHEPFGWVKDKSDYGDTYSAITKVSSVLIKCGEIGMI